MTGRFRKNLGFSLAELYVLVVEKLVNV